jgi:hypothetical protein
MFTVSEINDTEKKLEVQCRNKNVPTSTAIFEQKKKNEHVISTTVENVILGLSNKNAAVKITNCQLMPASSLPFIDGVDWCNP